MTQIIGMDPARVRELAGTLEAQATALDNVVTQINALIAHGDSVWRGQDFQMFRGWWEQQHRPRLQGTAEAIHGLGRSAQNNANEQDGVSSPGGGHVSPGGAVQTSGHVSPGGAATLGAPTGLAVTGQRDWHEVQQKYDAWAASPGKWAGWSDPGQSQYQCTAWANFRWNELGYNGIVSGNGGDMAGNAGPTTNTPSLHAMASYGGAGTSDVNGHVMVVEEIASDGSWARVSEMNAGGDGVEASPDEYRDQNRLVRGDDGLYRYNGRPVRFAAFPG